MCLGCVVRVESTEQDLRRVLVQVLPGDYLGVLHDGYLWRVHVTGRGLRVECLRGMKHQDGRCYLARGSRMSHRAGHRLAPREDVLFGHPKD